MKNLRIALIISIIAIIFIGIFIIQETPNTFGDFGNKWTEETLIITFEEEMQLEDNICVTFNAEITQPGTMYDFNYLGYYVKINDVDIMYGSSPSSGYGSVKIEGDLKEYTMYLPADLNEDGIVEWNVGDNELTISTWSRFSDKGGHVGVRSLEVYRCM